MKFSPQVEKYRYRSGPMASNTGEDFGAFEIPGPHGRTLRVIASSGDASVGIEWEHVSVSVSLTNRCPNWVEMCFIKDLFWDAEETVMQLHSPRSKWTSNHPHCLHMWRPLEQEIPLPPDITVGIKEAGELKSAVEAKVLRRVIESKI